MAAEQGTTNANDDENGASTSVDLTPYYYDPSDEAFFPPNSCSIEQFAAMSVGLHPRKLQVVRSIIDGSVEDYHLELGVVPLNIDTREVRRSSFLVFPEKSDRQMVERWIRLDQAWRLGKINGIAKFDGTKNCQKDFLDYNLLLEFAQNDSWHLPGFMVTGDTQIRSNPDPKMQDIPILSRVFVNYENNLLKLLLFVYWEYFESTSEPITEDDIKTKIRETWADKFSGELSPNSVDLIIDVLRSNNSRKPGRRPRGEKGTIRERLPNEQS